MAKKNRPRKQPPDEAPVAYVLGEAVAKAVATEQNHKAKGAFGRSPMPTDQYDDLSHVACDLRPFQVPLDSALCALTSEFVKVSEATRGRIRESISMDEFYTLIAFSRRAAVFALRERSVKWVACGLTAIAMIEAKRVDWRDIMLPLSLLNHAANRLGEDSNALLSDASALSELDVARLIDAFVKMPAEKKKLESEWGYREVQINGHEGFVRWEFEPYLPTCDLLTLAVTVADFIATDKYRPDDVQIATDLPSVWLGTSDNSTLQKALKSIRAGASVSAKLLPKEHPHADEQMFVVFIVETMKESAAETLLGLSRRKRPSDYALLGVADKGLFCLVVARSFVKGVESFETDKKLTRFAPGLASILHRFANE